MAVCEPIPVSTTVPPESDCVSVDQEWLVNPYSSARPPHRKNVYWGPGIDIDVTLNVSALVAKIIVEVDAVVEVLEVDVVVI